MNDDDDDDQISYLNFHLDKIYKLKKKRKDNDDIQDEEMMMIEKRNKYFYFKIKLAEMVVPANNNTIIYINNFSPHLSPQQIFIEYLKGNPIMKNIRNFFLQEIKAKTKTNIDLYDMVCPHKNKTLWYLEKDLTMNCILTVYCVMNLIDMKNILKSSPLPSMRFFPAQYNDIDNNKFIKIINNCNKEEKKTFNFLPYLRKTSQNSINVNNNVYYLYGDIEMISSKCFI